MKGVFLEEKRVSHTGSRAGKCPVAAHGHGIAVGGNAPVGEPVGGVAQLAGVDDILLVGASPHPVVALGQVVHVRHPAFQLHHLCRDELPADAAVQTHPSYRCAGAGQTAIEPLAARVGLDAQSICAGVVDDAVAVQLVPLPGLFRCRAGKGHGVLCRKVCPHPLCRDAAVVQHHRRPVAGRLTIYFQRALAAPRLFRVFHPQEKLAVRRLVGLSRAAAAHLVDLALRVAGCKLHAGVFARPHRAQSAHPPAGSVESQLVREDQDPRSDAHQRFPAVLHGVFQSHFHLIRVIRRVDEVSAADGQQAVQVIHPVQVCFLPQLPPGQTGAQGREIPGRKVDARAVLCLGAAVRLVQPAEHPQHVPGVFQAVPVRKYHLSPSLPAPAAAPGGQILPPQPRGQFG